MQAKVGQQRTLVETTDEGEVVEAVDLEEAGETEEAEEQEKAAEDVDLAKYTEEEGEDSYCRVYQNGNATLELCEIEADEFERDVSGG